MTASASADQITDWNATGITASVTAGKGPPAASIDLAYMHAAIYDAVNAIDGRFSVYAVKPSFVPADASKEAAAAAAAYNMLKSLLPAQHAFLDARYETALAAIPDGPAKIHGIAVGEEVAALFLALRAGDGRNANITYVPGSGPGDWQPTPPAFAAASYSLGGANATIRDPEPFTVPRRRPAGVEQCTMGSGFQ